MANVLGEEKKQQVLALGRLGWPLRQIEDATGIRRETASAYLKAAGIAVRAPRTRRQPANPASQVSTDLAASANPFSQVSTDLAASASPASQVSTDLGPRSTGTVQAPSWPSASRSPVASACEPHREFIEQAVARGRNAMAIWQDLVDDHGFTARYASVKRFFRKLRGTESPEAHAIITTPPGEEAQVDYGEGPMVRHPETGKYRRTRLFVLTLGHSRKSIRLLSFQSSSRIWAELHERSFRRLGGAPRVVVLDNLKEGVLKPDVYDPALNPLYRDVLAHYGAVALPCRVGDPDRKGKVESGVGHAQKTPLRGLRFEVLDEAQAHLDRWETRWADTRIHGTTKRQVAVMFAEELPLLLPLPLEPFRYYQYGERTVHLDGCVEVGAAYYGAPPGWIGRTVWVRWDGWLVRLIDPKTGQLLREHIVQARGHHRIKDEDRPTRTPKKIRSVLAAAGFAGPRIGALCEAIHNREGEPGIRRILGVLSLVKKHGAPVVDDACAAVLEMGVADYRFVRRYLERRPAPLSLKQIDPLIRELTHYRDLIDRKTKGEPT
jgi:transposase